MAAGFSVLDACLRRGFAPVGRFKMPPNADFRADPVRIAFRARSRRAYFAQSSRGILPVLAYPGAGGTWLGPAMCGAWLEMLETSEPSICLKVPVAWS